MPRPARKRGTAEEETARSEALRIANLDRRRQRYHSNRMNSQLLQQTDHTNYSETTQTQERSSTTASTRPRDQCDIKNQENQISHIEEGVKVVRRSPRLGEQADTAGSTVTTTIVDSQSSIARHAKPTIIPQTTVNPRPSAAPEGSVIVVARPPTKSRSSKSRSASTTNGRSVAESSAVGGTAQQDSPAGTSPQSTLPPIPFHTYSSSRTRSTTNTTTAASNRSRRRIIPPPQSVGSEFGSDHEGSDFTPAAETGGHPNEAPSFSHSDVTSEEYAESDSTDDITSLAGEEVVQEDEEGLGIPEEDDLLGSDDEESSNPLNNEEEMTNQLDEPIPTRILQSAHVNGLCRCLGGATSSNTRDAMSGRPFQYFTSFRRDTLRLPDVLAKRGIMPRLDDDTQFEWERLLAGETCESRRTLDMRLSDCVEQGDEVPDLQRTYDVDMVMLPLLSLGAHRHYFRLSYYSLFHHTMQSDQCIWLQQKRLHKCKNIRLGVGGTLQRWSTYIFFPHLKHKKTNTLTDQQQKIWVQSILIPALREVYSPHVLQHHPGSFDEASDKVRAKQAESTSKGEKHSAEILYDLPELDVDDDRSSNLLDELWRAIQRTISRRVGLWKWLRGAFLVSLTYDCKLVYRRSSARDLRECVESSIRSHFHWAELDMDNAWVDVACEDNPIEDGITLLRKSSCNEGITQTLGHRARYWQWQGTRDAGSVWTHYPRKGRQYQGGLAKSQAYNVLHRRFQVMDKNVMAAFSDAKFEGLALPQKLLAAYLDANRPGSGSSVSRAQLLSAYAATKARLSRVLKTAAKTSHGIRQEWRVRWNLFRQQLDFDGHVTVEIGDSPVGSVAHRPYWVFRSQDVFQYIRWDMNRWLRLVEQVADIRDRPGSPAPFASEVELRSALLVCAIRCASMSITSGCVASQNALYRQSYTFKHRPRVVHGNLVVEGEDEEMLGLDFESSLADCGMLWLPRHLFQWRPLAFTAHALARLAFTRNAYRTRLRNQVEVIAVDRTEQWLEAMAVQLRADRTSHNSTTPVATRTQEVLNIIYAMQQLCYYTYASDIIDRMHSDYHKADTPHLDDRKPACRDIKCHFYPSDMPILERQGLRGLDFTILKRLIRQPPIIAVVTGAGKNARGVEKQLSDSGNSWPQRLHNLFNWDDGVQRSWGRCRFREVARRCYDVISEASCPSNAECFRHGLGLNACDFLTVIPRYEKDRLRTWQKGSKHNTAELREYRRSGHKNEVFIGALPWSDPINNRNWWLIVDEHAMRREHFLRDLHHGTRGRTAVRSELCDKVLEPFADNTTIIVS